MRAMKPTLKQKRFVQEYVKNNGNGTRAAMKVYDVKDDRTATVIASENLTKPDVKQELERILQTEELSLRRFTDKLSDISGAEPVKGYSGSDILEAVKTGLKLHGVLTDRKQISTLNLNAELGKLSKYELLELRKKKVQATEAIIAGEEDL